MVARLTPAGSLDPSFGEDGIAPLPTGSEIVVLDVAPTPSGGVVVEGGNEFQPTLLELNGDGSIDRRFGNRGRLKITSRLKGDGKREGVDPALGVVVLPSGKLLLAGSGNRPHPGGLQVRVVVVRLLADGRIDASYGQDGWALAGWGNGWTLAKGLTRLADGDVVVATSFLAPAKNAEFEFGALAFGPAGKIDRNFGQNGRCRARLGGRNEAVGVAALGDEAVVGGGGQATAWLLSCA